MITGGNKWKEEKRKGRGNKGEEKGKKWKETNDKLHSPELARVTYIPK